MGLNGANGSGKVGVLKMRQTEENESCSWLLVVGLMWSVARIPLQWQYTVCVQAVLHPLESLFLSISKRHF